MKKTLQEIELIEEDTDDRADRGRVSHIRRLTVRNVYKDQSFSRSYKLDVVSHRGTDAVGVIPYWMQDGQPWVVLLDSFRPALAFRDFEPLDEPFLTEVVAGVLEDDETGIEGVRRCAVRELSEEVGLISDTSDVVILGEPFFSSPGIYTEKLWIVAIAVDPDKKVEAKLDGSVMEELLRPKAMRLIDARKLSLEGGIRDAKTEIAIERFVRWLATASE